MKDSLSSPVEMFREITGIVNKDEILGWLAKTDYNFELAVQLFLATTSESTSSSSHRYPSYTTSSSSSSSSHSDMYSRGNESAVNLNLKRKKHAEEMYDEDGIRVMPDEAKQIRLIENSAPNFGYYSSFQPLLNEGIYQKVKVIDSAFSGAESFSARNPNDMTLKKLYAAPHRIMCQESFATAKSIGKSQGKWLIVNIQDIENFSCHILNRDVWKDLDLQDLILSGYIFWQKLKDSEEGMEYIKRYNVTIFPHVAIIDPRTGAILWQRGDKPFSRNFISDKLAEFICDHELNAEESNEGSSNSNFHGLGQVEDDELSQAIAMSLSAESSTGPTSSISSRNSTVSTGSSSSSSSRGRAKDANVLDEVIDLAGDSPLAQPLNSKSSNSSAPEAFTPGFLCEKLPLFDEAMCLSQLTDDSSSSNPSDFIKIQFKFSRSDGSGGGGAKKVTKTFSVHCTLLVVAAFAAGQIEPAVPIDTASSAREKRFEIYVPYPRLGLSEAIHASTVGGDKEEATLHSIGITRDSSLIVQYL